MECSQADVSCRFTTLLGGDEVDKDECHAGD